MNNTNLVGALGFTSHRRSFNSWAIRQYTKSRFSHVLVIIGQIHGNYIVLEADEGRVDINLLSKYTMNKDMRLEVYDLNLHPITLQPAIKELLDKFQQVAYGDQQILGFGLEAIGWQRNPFRKGMVCSELATEYTRRRGVRDNFKDINLVDPEEVRQLVISIGAVKAGEKLYGQDMVWL